MTQFILTEVFLISLGAILYLMVRRLPQVQTDEQGNGQSFFEKLIHSGLPEKADYAINSSLSIILRKVKVWVMKIDNLITKLLTKVKNGNDNNRISIL